MTSKVKRELTYLIQFRILTQPQGGAKPARKSQLSECLAIMFSTSTETSFSNGSYFKCEKDDSKWNLCRQRINTKSTGLFPPSAAQGVSTPYIRLDPDILEG